MKRKFELSLTKNYVADWGVYDALRELIQNAIDQEVTIPDNKKSIVYKDETLYISNKSSVLERQSLLLGHTSKQDDDKTIGQFGEGYKIAFLVLTRLEKPVTVYNYGAKETWTVKFSKLKKYNYEKVLVVTVDDAYPWTKVPDDNLTIKVENITPDEYEGLIERTLFLQNDVDFEGTPYGDILFSDKHKGQFFVNGLYVTTNNEFSNGYNIRPEFMKIGRDRNLVDSHDLRSMTRRMWLFSQDNKRKLDLIKNESSDVYGINYVSPTYNSVAKSERGFYTKLNTLAEDAYSQFKEEYGEKATPVSTESENKEIRLKYKDLRPVVVNSTMKELINESDTYKQDLKNHIKTEMNYRDEIELFIRDTTYSATADAILAMLEPVFDFCDDNNYQDYLDEKELFTQFVEDSRENE